MACELALGFRRATRGPPVNPGALYGRFLVLWRLDQSHVSAVPGFPYSYIPVNPRLANLAGFRPSKVVQYQKAPDLGMEGYGDL